MELDELVTQLNKLPADVRRRIAAQLTEIMLRELVELVPRDGGRNAARPRRSASRARPAKRAGDGDGANRTSAGKRGRRSPVLNKSFLTWWDHDDRSPKDLAEQLGVSKPALYQWRSGRTRPSQDKRVKLEKLSGGAVPTSSWE